MRTFSKAYLVIITILIAYSLLTGCGNPLTPGSEEGTLSAKTDTPNLNISIVSDLSVGNTIFRAENINGNFANDLSYYNVTDVTIEIDGVVLPLEDALQSGALTEEEIFAFARQDAKQGFCTEEYQSRHGLTHFTYRYLNYNLRLIYDVYETPDGQQHLICDMAIYPPNGMILGEYVDFLDEESNERLDREDWGIMLEAAEVSSYGMSINCIQSAGQQIGQLHISNFVLANGNGFIECLNGSYEIPSYDIAIQMDGITQIPLDWTDIYGSLSSGTYVLCLYVNDVFDPAQVHPLMQDYHDMQIYTIEFSIP